MRGASGVATDPKGRYAAVAFAGTVVNGRQTGGRTTVFDADSGAVVTHIVTGFPGGESHDHLDVAWDNVGNLYLVDNYESVWRAYSPPGSNSATTYALGFLRLATPPLAPILKTVGYANGQFSFTLTGRTNLNYIIDASADLVNWSSVATNSDVCATRLVTVAAPQSVNFYRAWPEVIPVP